MDNVNLILAAAKPLFWILFFIRQEVKKSYNMREEEFANFKEKVAADEEEKEKNAKKIDKKLEKRKAKKELKQNVKDSCKTQW